MGFLGVYSAVYDYQPQGEGELEIREGDLLYIIEKNTEDDWWKARKKAEQDDEDEPEGLVPNNYVEEVSTPHYPSAVRRALSTFPWPKMPQTGPIFGRVEYTVASRCEELIDAYAKRNL